jgi:hypothetical protein
MYVLPRGEAALKGFHKLLATLIVFMLGAGVVGIVVKGNKTTPTAEPKAAITASPVTTPSVTPTTSVKASHRVPAPANSQKRSPADGMGNGPTLPVSGVGRYPAGLVFVVLAGALTLWLRRAARA